MSRWTFLNLALKQYWQKNVRVQNCREKKAKLYFYSLDCVAGAEVSRYTDDQDVVRSRIKQSPLQTNKQKIETEKPETDRRRRRWRGCKTG